MCDLIIYMLDARCPLSCLNPKFDELVARKPVLFILNKVDLAPSKTFFKAGSPVLELNSTLTGAGKKALDAINRLLHTKIAASKEKGINRTVRAMVIGVTNCGKSTFINNLVGKSKALVGDKPGVTRVKQWLEVRGSNVWLLDTPGTLWPQFSNPQIAKNLAYVGSIKDEVLDLVHIAKDLLLDLSRLDATCVLKRFEADTFEGICRKRGYILKGGVLDEERAAKAILTEFRAGKLGRFNLDALL